MKQIVIFDYKIGEEISVPIYLNDDKSCQTYLTGKIIGYSVSEKGKRIYRVALDELSRKQMCGASIYNFDEDLVSVTDWGEPNGLEKRYISLLEYQKKFFEKVPF